MKKTPEAATPEDTPAPSALIKKLTADGITDPAHQAIMTDEYAGKGGSYTFDPVTGLRTPNE